MNEKKRPFWNKVVLWSIVVFVPLYISSYIYIYHYLDENEKVTLIKFFGDSPTNWDIISTAHYIDLFYRPLLAVDDVRLAIKREKRSDPVEIPRLKWTICDYKNF